jgi:hypothetical protein
MHQDRVEGALADYRRQSHKDIDLAVRSQQADLEREERVEQVRHDLQAAGMRLDPDDWRERGGKRLGDGYELHMTVEDHASEPSGAGRAARSRLPGANLGAAGAAGRPAVAAGGHPAAGLGSWCAWPSRDYQYDEGFVQGLLRLEETTDGDVEAESPVLALAGKNDGGLLRVAVAIVAEHAEELLSVPDEPDFTSPIVALYYDFLTPGGQERLDGLLVKAMTRLPSSVSWSLSSPRPVRRGRERAR